MVFAACNPKGKRDTIPGMGMRNDYIYSCTIVVLLTAAGLVGAYVGGAVGLVVFLVIAGIGFFGITRLADSRPCETRRLSKPANSEPIPVCLTRARRRGAGHNCPCSLSQPGLRLGLPSGYMPTLERPETSGLMKF